MEDRRKHTAGRASPSDLAPELHNSEQDDSHAQAQQVAAEAQEAAGNPPGGTESRKPASPGVDNVAGSESDLIDEMRRMQESGMIDNAAFAGEPNHDDEAATYGDETTDDDDDVITDRAALNDEED